MSDWEAPGLTPPLRDLFSTTWRTLLVSQAKLFMLFRVADFLFMALSRPSSARQLARRQARKRQDRPTFSIHLRQRQSIHFIQAVLQPLPILLHPLSPFRC